MKISSLHYSYLLSICICPEKCVKIQTDCVFVQYKMLGLVGVSDVKTYYMTQDFKKTVL